MFSFSASAKNVDFTTRASDWKFGPVVYQVFVDRFAPPTDLAAKEKLFTAPRTLKNWNESPKSGHYLEKEKVWSHEVDFWGGDLHGLSTKLSYLKGLGVNIVYLNPIFEAFTNHKYDTIDYMKVDPAYGTNEELRSLISQMHGDDMRLVIDGVFNHMSARSPLFTGPQADKYFKFKKDSELGYIAWWNVANLPELNYDSPAVRKYIYEDRNSVVRSYLSEYGLDGWRLDVAYDLGPRVLAALTKSAHKAKADALVLGEVWNYPEGWNKCLDAISSMHGRQLIIDMMKGGVTPRQAARMWQDAVDSEGIEFALKSWLMLENHDVPRLPNVLPDAWQRHMARVLQFTLPGGVFLYYGGELGMVGGEDPAQRAPMRWDLVSDKNETLVEIKKLISMRERNPALKYGDFKTVGAEKVFAFMRLTDKVGETILVVANPSDVAVKDTLQFKDGRINSGTALRDQLSERVLHVICGTVDISLAPHEVVVLRVDTAPTAGGYARYDVYE